MPLYSNAQAPRRSSVYTAQRKFIKKGEEYDTRHSSIHHTAISTGDIERALRFYRDLLGFQEVWTSSWKVGTETVDKIVGLKDSSARVAMLKAGNACIELFQYETPKPKSGDENRPVCDHGITHLCLQVTDVEAEYERLKAAGMRFHCPPQIGGNGLRVTYGRDPDGNVVELLEITSQATMPGVQAG